MDKIEELFAKEEIAMKKLGKRIFIMMLCLLIVMSVGVVAFAVETEEVDALKSKVGVDEISNTGRYRATTLESFVVWEDPFVDDRSEPVPIGFDFMYQGQVWDEVYINSNGNLTFGVGDGNWIDSTDDFLYGPPRIAVLWDDWVDDDEAEVRVEYKKQAILITYDNVQHYWDDGRATFAVGLMSNGMIVFMYGDCEHGEGSLFSDSIVGISDGAGAMDPGEIDFSEASYLSMTGTSYEDFDQDGFDDFDLENHMLVFGTRFRRRN